MSSLMINQALLQEFELNLDPRDTQKGEIPAKVLGYGEISTTLEIGSGVDAQLAYKRVPMFRSELEADRYEALYREYIQLMNERVGIRVVQSDITRVVDNVNKRVVVYLVQDKLDADSVCSRLIHHLSTENVAKLVYAIVTETAKVFDFNQQHKGKLEFGLDGQISNWAVTNLDQATDGLPEKLELVYFDTSSPLMCKDGQEQLDPELFLRSAPSFLVWILRLLFLKDVMTRYYDFRKVSVDLLANFYKEQLPQLIPGLVDIVNQFFSPQIQAGEFSPITLAEIKSYYQEDAWIWRLYLTFRKVDRALHQLMGKYYPYILPAQIKR